MGLQPAMAPTQDFEERQGAINRFYEVGAKGHHYAGCLRLSVNRLPTFDTHFLDVWHIFVSRPNPLLGEGWGIPQPGGNKVTHVKPHLPGHSCWALRSQIQPSHPYL